MSPVSSASLPAETPGAGPRSGSRLLLVYHLGDAQAAGARRALAAGADVACLTADAAVEARLGDAVRVLGAAALPGFEDGAAVDGSFDLVEAGVEVLLARRPALARWLAAIAGSRDVDRYLCRSLLRDVGDFLSLLLLLCSPELAGYEAVVVERTWPFGPNLGFLASVVGSRRPPLPEPILQALDRLEVGSESAAPLSRRARGALEAARELAALWAQCLCRVRLRPRRLPRRPLLIRSYEWDWGVDLGGRRLRNLDFVVDGETIGAHDVGIWAEERVPETRLRLLAERGYAVLGSGDVTVGPFAFALRFLPRLLVATGLFGRLALAERWWHSPVSRLIFQTLFWDEVARRVRPRVFLALNDLHPDGVARTLALRRAGCLTVEYEFSSHWRTDEQGWIPDYVYGFTVVDAMVSWGPLHSDHFRNHRGAIAEFWEVGCLWSEHARLVREDAEIGGYYRDALAREHGIELDAWDAVVGVFDTSTASFFGFDDMVALYAGVAELARRLPRVLFLCKPKRPIADVFANGAGGREVEAVLTAAPSVAILDDFFETAAVVGFTDLSINACFTSPAVETIGMGRPALHYDPTDLFPRSFFRDVPRFVATTPDELASLVVDQLALSGPELEADLRERFSELEGHFDGLAITRLRERLQAELGRPPR